MKTNQDRAEVLSCIIIDDEPVNHQILKDHIQRVPWLSLLASCRDAIQGLRIIQKKKPDIVFLDINMPEISGLELLEMCPTVGSSVIIISAFQQFAIRGYDYDVVSFLVKPVTYKEFIRAVAKAAHRKSLQVNPLASPAQLIKFDPFRTLTADSPVELPAFDRDQLLVRSEKKIHCVRYENISFISGEHNYVTIHLNDRGALRTRTTLAEIAPNLPSFFVRTHRSFIVNRHQVCQIDGNTIELHNQLRVTIAKDERNEIFRRLAFGT